MSKRFPLFVLLALFSLSQSIMTSAWAVSFGHGTFLDPEAYFAKVAKDPAHPSHLHIDALRNASDATAQIRGRASAVIISPSGLVATSFHVISSFYVGPTTQCRKISTILFHQKTSEGLDDPRRVSYGCKELLVADFRNDFALYRLDLPPGVSLPYVPFARNEDALSVGMKAIVMGHPNSSNINDSDKKITEGPVVLYEPRHQELPHFLHLIDTEGGSSGGPIFSPSGELIGIHFRGIPNHGTDVPVIIDGKPAKVHRFNVALPFPDLAKKFIKSEWLDDISP